MGLPGHRFTIKLRHHGCWASGLSVFLSQNRGRPDIEMYVYVLDYDEEWYKVLLILKSNEGKEIDKDLEYEIRDFLVEHDIVRAYKPNLVKPLPYLLPFLIIVKDLERVPGAIRVCLKYGCQIERAIGMLVRNGVEHVVGLAKDPEEVYRTAAEYSRYPDRFEVLSTAPGPKYDSIKDIVNDEYYYISVLVTNPKLRKTLIQYIAKGAKDTTEFIRKNLWWLIPLLKEILKWMKKRRELFEYAW